MTAVNTYSPNDLRRIVSDSFVQQIDFHRELTSTNDRAMELATPMDTACPLLVLAESQTAGRGRGTNRWWSGSGALTFSVLLATDAAGLPAERWPQVSLLVGLAVCEAIEELLARGVPLAERDSLPPVQLKWPNDVYIEGRKICGILVEVPRHAPQRLLIGIGINVNNSLREAPPELQQIGTSLVDLTGRQHALAEVLILVLQRLAVRLPSEALWDEDVRAGWRGRCYLTGKKIQIDVGPRQVVGICLGIDDEGALLLDVSGNEVSGSEVSGKGDAGNVQRHLAGVVTILDLPAD